MFDQTDFTVKRDIYFVKKHYNIFSADCFQYIDSYYRVKSIKTLIDKIFIGFKNNNRFVELALLFVTEKELKITNIFRKIK